MKLFKNEESFVLLTLSLQSRTHTWGFNLIDNSLFFRNYEVATDFMPKRLLDVVDKRTYYIVLVFFMAEMVLQVL